MASPANELRTSGTVSVEMYRPVRNLLVLAMDNETEEDEEQQGGAKNGRAIVVVEMSPVVDYEAAVWIRKGDFSE